MQRVKRRAPSAERLTTQVRTDEAATRERMQQSNEDLIIDQSTQMNEKVRESDCLKNR